MKQRLFSVTQLSQLTRKARETIARRIREIKPAGARRGYPVYSLADVGPAIFCDGHSADERGPDDYSPQERKVYYEAEIKRLRYEEECGQLIRADDVRQDVAKVFKSLAQTLDSLNDVLERDAGLSPEQAAVIEQLLDREREKLYVRLSNLEEEDVD